MVRAVLVVVMTLSAVVMSGCAAPRATTSPTRSTAQRTPETNTRATERSDAAAPARLVGFWLRGVHVWHGPEVPEAEVIGFVMGANGPPRCDARELTDLLAHGEIIATFRSAREAQHVAATLARDGPSSARVIDWYCATHRNGWQFVAAAPPAQDQFFDGSSVRLWPGEGDIGPADAAMRNGATIVRLPPPLHDRGISVWRAPDGKGRSVRTVWPKDLSLTIVLPDNDSRRPAAAADQR